MKKFKYEYPLLTPNVILYRKNGQNEMHLFGYWDGGGCLEVYRTADDGECSLITLNLLEDEYTYWFDCLKQKPNVADYKIKILRNIYCPNSEKLILKEGEKFTGFRSVYLA